MVAALETVARTQGGNKSTKVTNIEIKATAQLKAKNTVTVVATSESGNTAVAAKRRSTPSTNNDTELKVTAGIKNKQPDKLSRVPEEGESVEFADNGLGFNEDATNVNMHVYQLDNTSDDSFNNIYAQDDTHSHVIVNVYAGADNDLHSDDDDYEEHEQDAQNAETEEDDEGEDYEGEDEEEAPLRPLKSRTKLVTAASKSHASVPPMCLKELVFLIPVHDQWGQDAIHQHSVSFDATAEQAILSIHTVIGSVKIPMEKRPPPVVKLAKTSSLKISLQSEQDWEKLKTIWQAEYMKKHVVYDVNVIMTKKKIKDIEEAVKTYMKNDKKTKAAGKAAKKKIHISPTRVVKMVMVWVMDVSLMLKAVTNTKHKSSVLSWGLAMVQGTEGVDIENPPHTNPFKDWYFKGTMVSGHAGARTIEDHYSTNAGGTLVTIHMPPEGF
ncbi:hypothetical protein K439DRAFT_1616504 [Ramaria rubella]|nr:hypothetical protein K439DRAFT_1616504 [Ramaria rubella]